MIIVDTFKRIEDAKTLRKLEKISQAVNGWEAEISKLDDEELKAKTSLFRERLRSGESLDQILPEAFAVVREAARRVLGQRHYDVQIMGGAALHWGCVAEMATGEGKTLVATLAAYLNALPGEGVHVITVNQYLAERDAHTMGAVYRFLGLDVGVLSPDMDAEGRRAAYQADITYGTNNEFGFDYLRDNMAYRTEQQVQREFFYAIVDEADSILIDEARTPLIISGPVPDTSSWHQEFASIAAQLIRDIDYKVDERNDGIGITDAGVAKVEKLLGVENLYSTEHAPLLSFLQNSMRAKELHLRDMHYIVTDSGEVVLVDQHTGRVMPGRRFSDGLHQALEAKEGVPVKEETQVYASVTLQNYFRMYPKLAGMTGTAETESDELEQTYGLKVIVIPPNLPSRRTDHPDRIFRTSLGRDQAVLAEVMSRHSMGQPVLLGTADVEASERCSQMLREHNIPHTVLNAKQNNEEALIVARAGQLGAVTVATNMAGRGTDILLGGDPELVARDLVKQRGFDPALDRESWEKALSEVRPEAKSLVEKDASIVRGLGGLYVLGMARHESRRIDNQLRGRSGRQGDPGESCFFLSLEDRILRVFNTETIDRLLRTLDIADNVPIEMKTVNSAVQSAQMQQEGMHFAARKSLLEYDEVINRQRHRIYEERQEVVSEEDLDQIIRNFVYETVRATVDEAFEEGIDEEDGGLGQAWERLSALYPIRDKENFIANCYGMDPWAVTEMVTDDALLIYQAKRERIGVDKIHDMEKNALLSIIDLHWRDHLFEMDYLKQGISLRSWGSRNPQVEYAMEGYQMFTSLMESIKRESVRLLFAMEPGSTPGEEHPELIYSGPSEPGVTSTGGATAKGAVLVDDSVSLSELAGDDPNSPCPCGSGKKYKRCHGSRSREGVKG